MVLADLPYMFSFSNVSDTKLVYRPKVFVFVTFYGNHGVLGGILHSTQLDHGTKKTQVSSKSDIATLQVL